MTTVQIWGLALGTVLLANATAVSVYLINSGDSESEQTLADTVDSDQALAAEADNSEGEKELAESGADAAAEKFSGYDKTPYSEHYAISACEDEVDNKFSAKLVHKHVVDLSTRYDDYVEYFVVVIYAHLGVRDDYSEVKIYCHVDPKTYTLSYFKDYPA